MPEVRTTLADLLAPLGWAPILVPERTEAALEQLLADVPPARELLEPGMWAVLQGVPVRPADRRGLSRMAHERWLHTVEQPTRPALRSGDPVADIRAEPARPPTRAVADPADGEPVVVVDREELYDDADALSPGMRAAAGRLLGRGG